MNRLLIAAIFLLAPGLSTARPALEKPNIIMILLDDAGYADFTHSGNPVIQTPNLSKMVSEGLNFPQFYSGSPACSASRYSLLTGRNPARSGLGNWVLGPGVKAHIHPSEVTLPEGLRERGYATAMFGKWHLGTPNAANGMTPDALPLAHGFDQWLGTNVSHDYDQSNLIQSDPGGTTPVVGYRILESGIFKKTAVLEGLTKRYTDGVIDYIHAKKDVPFFIYLAHNLPHLPVVASDEFKGRSPRGRFGDSIEEIDHHLGRIRKALEDDGIDRNTLVIFASDNGPWIYFHNTVNDPRYGEARMGIGSAAPFRDGKGSTWEGGQRVPGVFWWPGTIPGGGVSRQPASTLDVLPTAFGLAGKPLPAGRTIDGRDIRPYLNAGSFPGKVAPFVFYYAGFTNNLVGAVRRGPWKLHVRILSQTGNNYGFSATPAAPLLFNVEEDAGERFDRAAGQPAEVNELRSLLEDFNTRVAAEGTFWD